MYVMFSCSGRHKWNGRRLFCMHLSSLCSRVIGVVATWADGRFPRFDFFVPNWGDGCASFVAASTTEQTKATEAKEGNKK